MNQKKTITEILQKEPMIAMAGAAIVVIISVSIVLKQTVV